MATNVPLVPRRMLLWPRLLILGRIVMDLALYYML